MKNKLIKELFQNMMDEALPDDLSDLAASVKDVITEPDKMTTRSRFKKLFKGPDPATIPTPHLMSDKENNIVDLDNIFVINCDEANSIYRTQENSRKKSKLKNISNEKSGESEEE